MGNVYAKVVEKIKTHILYSITFFQKLHVYEIIPKNMVETEGPQMTSQHGAYELHAGLARLYALMRMHKLTRPSTYMHAGTHVHTEQ